MEELYNLGINEEKIKDILEVYPNIKELSNIDIYNKIEILKNINCNVRQIKNIIVSNPQYLDRSDEDILNLIKKLVEIQIKNINLLFDSNPSLLNRDAYEINNYLIIEKQKGKSFEKILNEFETNPYIIDEI